MAQSEPACRSQHRLGQHTPTISIDTFHAVYPNREEIIDRYSFFSIAVWHVY